MSSGEDPALSDGEGAARRESTRHRGPLALVAVALLGLLATLVATALFHAASAQDEARRRDETVFAVRSLLQADLLRVSSQLGGFSAWIEETGFDDPLAFQAYYDRATRYMDPVPWRAVAVAELLPRDELRARVAALDARRILYDAVRYPRLELFPLSDAPVAAPVLMVEPRAGRRRVFGYDMASDPMRREAILETLDADRPVLTPLLRLTPDADGASPDAPLGVLLLAPLQRAREEAGYDRGVLAFSLVPERLVAAAITRASAQDVDWRLSVVAAPEAAPESRIEVEAVTTQLLRVHFLDQLWNVELVFRAASPSLVGSGTLLVFVLGLLATGLAVALTLRMTSEQHRLQLTLAARTDELARTRDAIADAHRVDALGRLTGGVAHDFNNLLGVIAGNLDLLRDHLPTDAPDEALDFIDDATTATERGARLTQKLLTLSRQASLRAEPLALDDVVRDMAGVLRRTLPATIDVATRLAGSLPYVEADRVQLESAVLNLAINARDAMPEGGRITLSTALVRPPPGSAGEAEWVELSVTDTGTGMAAETARRAFDPFFTTKDVGKGTGLGLSIVAGFVAQSGGEVAIDSVEGQGTSIRLRFPPMTGRDVDPVDDDAQEWTPVAREAEVVAVIEDNAELRLILDRQLRALGYEVLSAEDGRAGLDMIGRARRVDLVLSDCVLPGDVDGYAVAQELARLRPDLPVLLMSGYADPPEPDPESPGPTPIRLTKPIRRAELAREIRSKIDGRS